ncbi:hypothetical protein [Lentilactobacillus diolivorans]|uniref:D-alanyl-D-alanine carboxypeptidase n=2 Tax=Lentilactobacillus diolivorans TaxID=179838 RepID=A0A0R1S685_9LACO|nr:hypothetical protein [Lentilactobacillus diolivorans]KRL64396.1 hypothetical protein FC85_GL000906 [Lentilactobacillus diolivorans DSM 14421]GEP23109.1 hypothetical protein LDI01_07020 [Lentilactobacillus diolivorans]
MRKFVKNSLLVATFIGTVGVSSKLNTLSTAAKAWVISTHAISKKPYTVSNGYFYSSPKLTKKVHNQHNFLRTTFYSYKSATVKKNNGHQAVYYYVKNKSGSVKGWVWRGSLQKPKSYAQEKSDMNAVVTIIKGMSQQAQTEHDNTLNQFRHMDYKHPYQEYGSRGGRCIYSVLSNIGDCLEFPAAGKTSSEMQMDIQGALKFYKLFKDRFNSDDKQRLISDYDNLDDIMHSKDPDVNYLANVSEKASFIVVDIANDINAGDLQQ